MALKKFNPSTPSQRNLVLVNKSSLHKGGPVKKLTEGLSKRQMLQRGKRVVDISVVIV